jgi:transposase, IS30 family
MSTHYNHLSEKKRILLSMMLQRGYSKSKIAANLGVNRSTVYREIKRNSWKAPASGNVYYTPMHAQKKYTLRRKRSSRLLQDEKLRSYIEEKLQLGWSPWQIEGRLKLANQGRCVVSHETIYRYIYSDNYKRNKLHKKLRRRHFNRVQRGKRKKRIPEEMRISHRPENINNREEFGHWECDLMIFKHGIKGNLITLRERKTRYMLAIKNNDKTATGTALTLISTIKTLKSSIKSIWSELIDRLATRDLINEVGEEKYYSMEYMERAKRLMDFEDRYGNEFEKNGLENLRIKQHNLVEN